MDFKLFIIVLSTACAPVRTAGDAPYAPPFEFVGTGACPSVGSIDAAQRAHLPAAPAVAVERERELDALSLGDCQSSCRADDTCTGVEWQLAGTRPPAARGCRRLFSAIASHASTHAQVEKVTETFGCFRRRQWRQSSNSLTASSTHHGKNK